MYLKEFWELWVSLGLPYTATQHDEQERGVSHPQVIKSRPVPFSMDCVYETPQPSCLSVNGRPSFFLCWQKAELVKNFWFNKDKFSTGTKLQLPSAALQWSGLQSLGSCDVLGVPDTHILPITRCLPPGPGCVCFRTPAWSVQLCKPRNGFCPPLISSWINSCPRSLNPVSWPHISWIFPFSANYGLA